MNEEQQKAGSLDIQSEKWEVRDGAREVMGGAWFFFWAPPKAAGKFERMIYVIFK